MNLDSASFKCPYQESRLKTTESLVNRVRSDIRNRVRPKQNLVWLELNGCTGNTISLLDGQNPDFQYLLTQMSNFIYSNSLIASEGDEAMEQLFGIIGSNYILAAEGAVSLKDNGSYQTIGRRNGREITGLEAVKRLGERAAHVIAVGACASHGGVSAARPNPTQCVGIQDVLGRKVIKLTGCPCHPDWFMGTLAYLILYGEPPLDNRDRPLMFYSTTIHDRCPRRSYYDNGIFAEKLGEETCLFMLGCKGPVTEIDCPIRQWNGHVNWPVGDDSPCIGCAQFGFPDAMEPFIIYDTMREE
ncbi:hydrogenase small subunit [Lacrimispora indolis]|uniref:hydrogenase small subunit n=1 Tax=Lacrimispora indolis TaxID=69825 RepID=UPI0003F73F0D|nr:Ni/Fe hydrogenase [Lacrimispora celerecrescens]